MDHGWYKGKVVSTMLIRSSYMTMHLSYSKKRFLMHFDARKPILLNIIIQYYYLKILYEVTGTPFFETNFTTGNSYRKIAALGRTVTHALIKVGDSVFSIPCCGSGFMLSGLRSGPFDDQSTDLKKTYIVRFFPPRGTLELQEKLSLIKIP
jgi:hypothetical protein